MPVLLGVVHFCVLIDARVWYCAKRYQKLMPDFWGRCILQVSSTYHMQLLVWLG